MFINNKKFKEVETAVENSDWVYSKDGKNLKFAHGFWDKLKVAIKFIFQPAVYGSLRDKAILKIFDSRMRPLILLIKKHEDENNKLWFNDSKEWTVCPTEFLEKTRGRNQDLQSKIDQLKKSPKKEFSDDWQEFDKSNLRYNILNKISSVFASASIANLYFKEYVYGKIETSQGTYEGFLENGAPKGKGALIKYNQYGDEIKRIEAEFKESRRESRVIYGKMNLPDGQVKDYHWFV